MPEHRLCDWCGRENEVVRKWQLARYNFVPFYCPSCGHRGDVGRGACDCPKCQRGPSPEAPEAPPPALELAPVPEAEAVREAAPPPAALELAEPPDDQAPPPRRRKDRQQDDDQAGAELVWIGPEADEIPCRECGYLMPPDCADADGGATCPWCRYKTADAALEQEARR